MFVPSCCGATYHLRDYFDTKERHGAGAPAEVEREDGDLKKRERVRERESWMRLRVGKSLRMVRGSKAQFMSETLKHFITE